VVIPVYRAGSSRVTHPFAGLPEPEGSVLPRLACVRRAASVRPEPGSNSPLEIFKTCSLKDPWMKSSPLLGPQRNGFRVATVIKMIQSKNSWKSCPEPVHVFDRPISRVPRRDALRASDAPFPKAGLRTPQDCCPVGTLHVHWLLAHCAVFKERGALHPSSGSLSTATLLRHGGRRLSDGSARSLGPSGPVVTFEGFASRSLRGRLGDGRNCTRSASDTQPRPAADRAFSCHWRRPWAPIQDSPVYAPASDRATGRRAPGAATAPNRDFVRGHRRAERISHTRGIRARAGATAERDA
jgi:hypothetical protein